MTITAAILDVDGVLTFPDAPAQVRRWRALGLRIAFISASRSAGRILAQQGLDRLCDVLVDGEVARERGLQGKAAILREATRRLQVEPGAALVVEDAVPGIEAAATEGFALLVGVDRTGDAAIGLRAAGAHRVVRRLDALDDVLEPDTQDPRSLPSALRIPLLEAAMGARRPALFLEEAVVEALLHRAARGGRRLLQDLAERMWLGVVSARPGREVEEAIGVEGIWTGPSAEVPGPGLAPIQVGVGEPVDLPCGVGVLVGCPSRRTQARLRLEEPEVPRLLRKLLDWHDARREEVWTLRYDHFEPGQEGLREALCTLGNGVIATRGAAEESAADEVHYPGTYAAGGYDALPTELKGEVLVHEDLVNWPNWLLLSHRPETGAWLDLRQVRILDFQQVLDVRHGILRREVRFRDDAGRTTTLRSTRLVSMDMPNVVAIRQEIVPEDWSGVLDIRSGLDGTVRNAGVERYRSLRGAHLRGTTVGQHEEAVFLTTGVHSACVSMAQMARTRVRAGETLGRRLKTWSDRIEEHIRVRATEDVPVRIEKGVVIRTSRDHAAQAPLADAQRIMARLPDFDTLAARHRRQWAQIWRRCDVRIGADHAEAQRILRLHLFHLMQVTSPHIADRDVGVPARGLHGEAYRGHIFWDEVFVFPWLDSAYPDLTRELLMYRYRRLDAARRLARDEGRSGAAYPWQSGSSGEEESARLHLNPRSGRWLPDHTHLQRHVGAAIAYNVWRHYESTGDHGFLSEYGAEMLLEIARYWASRAEWDPSLHRYRIRGVVGPDEFHTTLPGAVAPGVDDNAYTNVMAAWCLRCARQALDELTDERRVELLEMLGITDAELRRWGRVASRLRLAFLDNGLIAQFDGWGDLQELDWEGLRGTHGDIHRLDRILESMGDDVNRYRVTKQADLLMLFYLFSAQELTELLESMGYAFDSASIPAHVDYYLQRTSHGSTLSRVVHSWVLARSDRARSWTIFLEALRSDVYDVQGGTTAEGIHLGAMAGTVDLVRRGYTGAVVRGGVLWLEPHLPDEVSTLALRFLVRGAWLDVEIHHDTLQVGYHDGRPARAEVGFRGQVHRIARGTVRRFPLVRAPTGQPAPQGPVRG